VKDSRTSEPCVGIFWLFDGELIIDFTPLSKAEPYDTALTHPTGHIDYWARLQHTGTVPADVEYEEPPRGRVVFIGREQRFHLYADKCILSQRKVVRKIMDAMHLSPGKTSELRDLQYRCFNCLYPAVDEDDF
jgi:hypothetical protein